MNGTRQRIGRAMILVLAAHPVMPALAVEPRVDLDVSGPSAITIVWEIPEELLVQEVADFEGFELSGDTAPARDEELASLVTTRGKGGSKFDSRTRPAKGRFKKSEPTQTATSSTDETIAVVEPSVTTEPSLVTETVEAPEPTFVKEPVEPSVTPEPTLVKEPVESSVMAEPLPAKEPVEAFEPTFVKEPVDSLVAPEPSLAKEPVEGPEPTFVKESVDPSVTPEPSLVKEPVEEPEPTSVKEPIAPSVAPEPLPAKEPVDAPEPTFLKEPVDPSVTPEPSLAKEPVEAAAPSFVKEPLEASVTPEPTFVKEPFDPSDAPEPLTEKEPIEVPAKETTVDPATILATTDSVVSPKIGVAAEKPDTVPSGDADRDVRVGGSDDQPAGVDLSLDPAPVSGEKSGTATPFDEAAIEPAITSSTERPSIVATDATPASGPGGGAPGTGLPKTLDPQDLKVSSGVESPVRLDFTQGVALAAQQTPFSYHVYRKDPAGKGRRQLTAANGPRNPVVNIANRALRGIFTDTSVVAGNTYGYAVAVVLESTGEEVYRTPEVFVTAHDDRVPGRVQGLSAEHAQGGIRLTWDALGDDEVTAYRIYRETLSLRVDPDSRLEASGRDSGFVQSSDIPEVASLADTGERRRYIEEVGANENFYVDTDLETAFVTRGYSYSVAAVDPYSGEGPRSREVQIAPPDRTPPRAPSDVRARIADRGLVELTWSASPSSDTARYRIYRQVGQGDPTRLRDTEATADALLLVRDPIEQQMDFPVRYQVAARDRSGNESARVSSGWLRIPDSFPPDPPTISAISSLDGVVELSWNAPAATDVVGYRVVRAPADDRPLPTLSVGTVQQPTFVDRNVDIGGVYAYSVIAIDRDGNASRESRPQEQKVVGRIEALPPSGVAARSTAGGAPTVSWRALAGSVRIRYVVFSSESRDGEYAPVSGVLSGTSFTDRDGAEGRWYRVVARYVDGQISPFSEPVTASSERPATLFQASDP